MLSSNDKVRILRRAALELRPGMTVNLGIGLPTGIVDFIEPELDVCLHSENGISGVGPVLPVGQGDRNLIDAGGGYVSLLPGSAFFDSAVSFALVRGGRLDLAMLGALEVAANGDLANWIIPGKYTPGVGGGIELAQKAQRVVVLTSHRNKRGHSKIVAECRLPLTAPACVDRIITDLAVLDISDEGLTLRETAHGVSIDEVAAATDADLIIHESKLPNY